MPATIRTLQDKAGGNIYPETIISAVNMLDGKRTLDNALEDISDDSCVISFNNGGVTKTMTNSGMIIQTTFANNVVTETCRYSDLTLYYTKTTTFNTDGSITVDKQYANNGG